ncbi:MAG: O-antigen ligase family protein [Candidatus Binatia bacterium]|nr:O-antigen ligase family protein [Candidatus Binatia bacterium]
MVTAGLIFIIVFAPSAFGSVHPQAYGLLEIAACGLVIVWLVKLRFGVGSGGLSSRNAGLPAVPRMLWAPLVGFLGVVLLQILPLPPALLGAISPSTYATYELSLPGWPEKAPYEDTVRALLVRDDAGVQAADLAQPVALPAVGDVEKFDLQTVVPDAWGRLPGEPLLERNERMLLERWVGSEHAGFFSSWRTISLDPSRTLAELLKILAYLAVFAVVTFYPLEPGSREDQRFQRRLLQAVAFTAIAVAAVGLLQRMSWNGKILWFFVPWDWGEPRLANPQTSGPFVSRNNFGGYLALTLPLVLAPLLARTRIDLRRPRLTTQVIFGAGAAICGTALFFSLSRGSWGAAAVSLSVFLFLLVRHVPVEKRAGFLAGRRAGMQVGAGVAAVMLLFVLLPSGGAEMGSDIDRRLEQTVSNSASWDSRVEGWRDSVPMITDYPLLGVGLSSWGVAFPQYDESFFFGSQARRAHNDYIQLFAETGLVGGLMLVFACVVVARRFLRVLRTRSDSAYVLQLAIGAGLLALLIHEFVDFDLQMPGIAITAVLLLGIGLRGGWRVDASATDTSGQRTLERPLSITSSNLSAVVVVVFLVLVFSQRTPGASREAPRGMMASLRSIADFPVDSNAHLNLSVRFSDMSLTLAQSSVNAAVMINPSSPGARDARAVLATRLGNRDMALADIEESMFRAPSRVLHPVLSVAEVSWLSKEVREATERGFRRAMKSEGYRAAVSLAAFYSDISSHSVAAEVWLQAADLAPRHADKAIFLRQAARELVKAGDLAQSEVLIRRSIAMAPSSLKSRRVLITEILGRQDNLSAAVEEFSRGIESGIDEYELTLALADAGRLSQVPEFEVRKLEHAIRVNPFKPKARLRLGKIYLARRRYDLAAQEFRLATNYSPRLGEAWYLLGLASERAYDFDTATSAYQRAADIAPQSAKFARGLAVFSARQDIGSDLGGDR